MVIRMYCLCTIGRQKSIRGTKRRIGRQSKHVYIECRLALARRSDWKRKPESESTKYYQDKRGRQRSRQAMSHRRAVRKTGCRPIDKLGQKSNCSAPRGGRRVSRVMMGEWHCLDGTSDNSSTTLTSQEVAQLYSTTSIHDRHGMASYTTWLAPCDPPHHWQKISFSRRGGYKVSLQHQRLDRDHLGRSRSE